MTPYEKEVQNMHLISEWLQVDPTSPTGLIWKKQSNRGRARVGRPAGSPEGKGYYRVILNKIPFNCHRLVLWLTSHQPKPEDFCDHINRNKSDNRPENLRWVSRSTNMVNTTVRNKHGFKYVCFNPKGGRYRAQWGRTEPDKIRMFYVGTYDTPYEAHIAALAHRLEHHWNPLLTPSAAHLMSFLMNNPTPLSPAANAVWEAFNQDETGVFIDYGDKLAAALRAAADQTAPEKQIEDIDYVHQSYVDGMRDVLVLLLEIADELDSANTLG